MPPKGKGKKGGPKKGCLRCPADADEVMRCSQTLRCKNDTGDHANLENLWPGFPSDPETSFARKTDQDCEHLLTAAETRKEYMFEDITKQMLEQALKTLQEKGKSKPPKVVAGPSTASSSKTVEAPAATTEADPEPGVESPRTPPEGPKLSSFHELTLKERQDPFAKLMHSSKLGRSVTTPLKRPQMALDLDMPRREPLPRGNGPDAGNPVDCRQTWSRQLPQIEQQKNTLQDHSETYALRPGFANTQAAIMVRTNHFVVDLDPKKELYEYEILGISDNISRAEKRDLVETMMLNCPVLRDQPEEYATDYKKKVIAWKDLFTWHAKEDPEESTTISIPGRPDASGQATPTVLRLNFVRKLSVHDLVEYVKGKQITFANNGVIEALNILISRGVSEASAKSIEVGTNRFYYKPGHSSLTDGLIAIRGYFASIRPGMGNVLLNVNTVMGAFYDAIRVDQLLEKFPGDKRRIERFLKGVRVRIMYSRERPKDPKGKQPVLKDTKGKGKGKVEEESIDSERRRTKSIWGIGQAADQQTFQKDGKRVDVLSYLRETYPHIRIMKTKLPCINLGNDAQPSWFLPEHLFILPYQLYKSKLDPTQVAEMIKHACRDPDTNRMLIMEEGLPSIGITEQLPRVLQKTNIRLNRNMLDIPGFTIPMPIIQTSPRPHPHRAAPRSNDPAFAPKSSTNVSNNSAFGYHWEMTRNKPLNTRRQYRPSTHFIYVDQSKRPLQQFTIVNIVEEFNREIPAYGFGQITLMVNQSTSLNGSVTNQGIARGLEAAAAQKADLVVLLLPSSGSANAGAYRYFKSQADQVYGFKSITMAEDKLSKGGLTRAMRGGQIPGCLKYYMSGVALKLNLKLGNWNWELGGDELRNHVRRMIGGRLNTLILGADVTHPSAASVDGCPSIAAVVGNVDLNCGNMPGSMRRQTSRNEMIEALDSMVEERLRDWNLEARTAHSYDDFKIPQRIIYYRDGVSESQYAAVKAIELPQIRAAWGRARARALAEGTQGMHIPENVTITMVLVSKRHNTRFYPSPANHPLRDTEGQRSKGKGNLKPGVVIESVVTSPYWHDFYLNSHFGLQGTVRPCHYIVLEDENRMSAEGLQKLTFLLCHMYQRAMCSVSYVTPTYYADRLCERGRHYMAEFFDGYADVRDKSDDQVQRMMDDAWYRGNPGGAAGGRLNPWHENLDRTMFWL